MTHIHRRKNKPTSDPSKIIAVDRSYMPMSELDYHKAISAVATGRAKILDLKTWSHMTLDGFPISEIRVLVFPRDRVVRGFQQARRLVGPSAILRRDGHECQYCGEHATTVDHVLPKSRGGKTHYRNLVAACWSCNQRKANRTPAEANMKLRRPIAQPLVAQPNENNRLYERFILMTKAAS
jgi:5-methylcytosine-specific restriction endonuclease McrA